VPFTEDWKHFRFEVEDGVATITFDRPERLNALTFDVYADLRDLLAELPHRDDVRAGQKDVRYLAHRVVEEAHRDRL
jgi:1,4-dihydroxy-2-naphthoyl-CoA synthase